jgi:uncharacterized RDD family membrane protein YckC
MTTTPPEPPAEDQPSNAGGPPPPPPPPPNYGQAPAYGQNPYAAPAGVPVQGELAQWGDRVVAALIDFLFLLPLSVLASVTRAVDLGGIANLFSALSFAAGLYFMWLNGSKGQTPGKAIRGLKVIGEQTGQPIGGPMGLVRYLAALAIGVFTCGIGFVVDYLFPLWDAKRQTLHDKVVKTVVIKGLPAQPVSAELLKP